MIQTMKHIWYTNDDAVSKTDWDDNNYDYDCDADFSEMIIVILLSIKFFS